MRKLDILGKFALVILLASCEYHVQNEDLLNEDPCVSAVSYSATIRPLIDSSCMPCHNGDGSIPDAPDLTTFAGLESRAVLIRDVTQSRRMPKDGTITDAQIAAIKCWVENGALDN